MNTLEYRPEFIEAEQALIKGLFGDALAMLLPLLSEFESELSGECNSEAALHAAIATAYFGVKQFSVCIDHFEKALAVKPDDVNWLTNYATALSQVHRWQDAVYALERVLKNNPNAVDARLKLVAVLISCKQTKDALNVVQIGLKTLPDNQQLLAAKDQLSQTVMAAGVSEKSLPNPVTADRKSLFDSQQYHALTEQIRVSISAPDHMDRLAQDISDLTLLSQVQGQVFAVWHFLAICLQRNNQIEAALHAYQIALKLNNTEAVLLDHASSLFRSQYQFKQANYCMSRLQYLHKGLSHSTIKGLAFFTLEQADYQQAITLYQSLLSVPEFAQDAQMSIALIKLLHGEYQSGWQAFSHRYSVIKQFKRHMDKGIPVWQGEPLADKTLAIIFEQGHGDNLMFWRFFAEVCQQARKVIYKCNPLLTSFAKQVFADIANLEIVESDIEHADYIIPNMEFGRLLALDEAKIAASSAPYLPMPNRAKSEWISQISQDSGFKVGLVWRGNPDNHREALRSMALSDLTQVLGVAGCQFYSLQYEVPVPAEQQGLVKDFSGQINGFEDTAQLLEQMDLLISVDTAVAHLAGALGVPTWLMISHVPDWRWLLNRDDSIWYQSVRLFRQSQIQQWQDVTAKISQQLQAKVTQQFGVVPIELSRLQYLVQHESYLQAKQALALLNQQPEPLPCAYQLEQVKVLAGLGQFDEALARLAPLQAHQTLDAADYFFRSKLALNALQFDCAYESANLAFALQNQSFEYLNHSVQCAMAAGKLAYAEHSLLSIIKTEPANTELQARLLLQLAEMAQMKADFKDAEALLIRANVSGYSQTAMAFAELYLRQGDFTNGWYWFLQRYGVDVSQRHLTVVVPELESHFSRLACNDLTLLLHAESSLTEQIMMVRYLPIISQRFNKLYLQIDSRLQPLLTAVGDNVELIYSNVLPPDTDRHLSLMDLPAKLAANGEITPEKAEHHNQAWQFAGFEQPYLAANRQCDRQLLDLLVANKKNIGVVWQSDWQHPQHHMRSLPNSVIEPLAQLSDVNWISLQQGSVVCPSWMQDAAPYLSEYQQTAALIEQLDLVISIDCDIAHLAAAMGKPCWVLLPRLSHWRWLAQGDACYWYQSVKLFRQSAVGDWTEVVERIVEYVE